MKQKSHYKNNLYFTVIHFTSEVLSCAMAPEPFLTIILPETPSLHMHEGTSDTAHLLSKHREQHSGIFPASGKASCLATKCFHFLCKTATYIYETSMQIPCNIQLKLTFLSETKYRKFFSALHMCNWPQLYSRKEKTTKTSPKPHTTILDVPVPSSSSTQGKETIVQAQTMEWEKADGNSDH